ncbi:hypothetical protein QBZ16_000024 [Prototheca wickerhamii]|uniref:Helicase ATP-binding domain-containing protein n=1 Tax=Prototheca wickerhamii TaxID=3111 RepID=A0AAD9IM60_PROWI|nr:hypothetical protein QBZ16_000024 [Prototheca wickerhamii]
MSDAPTGPAPGSQYKLGGCDVVFPHQAYGAARKHYCVNKTALSKPSVEEACEELLKDGMCSYFRGVQAAASSGYSHRVHDIEDLRNFARGQRACPYFLASKWSKEADLVFSPYSYLVDPVIRRALDIAVEGHMLVFDEAHNMEDVAREAASLHLTSQELLEVQTAFARAVALNEKPDVYGPLAQLAQRMLDWVAARETDVAMGVLRFQKQSRFEKEEVVYQGAALEAHLRAMGLERGAMEALWQAYQDARAEDEALQQGRDPSDPGPEGRRRRAAAPGHGGGRRPRGLQGAGPDQPHHPDCETALRGQRRRAARLSTRLCPDVRRGAGGRPPHVWQKVRVGVYMFMFIYVYILLHKDL